MRRMMQVVGWILRLAILGALGLWLFLYPGKLHIDWQGWSIDTTTTRAGLILAVIMFLFAAIYHLWRKILSWPTHWQRQRRVKSLEIGYGALNKGLLAVANGDRQIAARQALRARKLLPDLALTHLLSAQAAQLNDDEVSADAHLAALAMHPEGQMFGLKGQIRRALQRHDRTEALRLARFASQNHAAQPWVIDTLVQLEARAQNWLLAEKTLRQAIRLDNSERLRLEHDLAAVLLALSDQSKATNSLDAAMDCAKEAMKLHQGWSPAAIRIADLWQRKGYRRRAQKALTNAWEKQPHPDLVQAWLKLSGGERSTDAGKGIDRLIEGRPDDAETALALAEASRQAGLWGVARQHAMKALNTAPSRRVYRLLAQIDQNDPTRAADAKSWLVKAAEAPLDAAWVCRATGERFDAWQPLNSQGDFNTIDWATPNDAAHFIAHDSAATALLG